MTATSFGLPRDVSVDGWRIDRLINLTLVAITILFTIMVVWLVYASIRHGRNHRAAYSHGDSRRDKTMKLGTAGLIFLAVDGTLLINSTHDMDTVFWNFKAAEARPGAVRIEINAHQWAWDARYAGPDETFNTKDDVLSLNDIRIPVGAPVIFQLASTDVIHSFYLPNLRVKQDVVPGSITSAWFEAKETGTFEIACAQHCGVNHYLMKGTLTVLPRDEYEEWSRWASKMSEKIYDPENGEANWGWPWRRQ